MPEQLAEIERRRHPRTQLNMPVSCLRLDPEDGDVLDSIHLVDVSRSGLGAISERYYYPGQRVVLTLPLTTESGRRVLYASVVRCRQRAEGYHIGLEFDATSVVSYAGYDVAMAAA